MPDPNPLLSKQIDFLSKAAVSNGIDANITSYLKKGHGNHTEALQLMLRDNGMEIDKDQEAFIHKEFGLKVYTPEFIRDNKLSDEDRANLAKEREDIFLSLNNGSFEKGLGLGGRDYDPRTAKKLIEESVREKNKRMSDIRNLLQNDDELTQLMPDVQKVTPSKLGTKSYKAIKAEMDAPTKSGFAFPTETYSLKDNQVKDAAAENERKEKVAKLKADLDYEYIQPPKVVTAQTAFISAKAEGGDRKEAFVKGKAVMEDNAAFLNRKLDMYIEDYKNSKDPEFLAKAQEVYAHIEAQAQEIARGYSNARALEEYGKARVAMIDADAEKTGDPAWMSDENPFNVSKPGAVQSGQPRAFVKGVFRQAVQAFKNQAYSFDEIVNKDKSYEQFLADQDKRGREQFDATLPAEFRGSPIDRYVDVDGQKFLVDQYGDIQSAVDGKFKEIEITPGMQEFANKYESNRDAYPVHGGINGHLNWKKTLGASSTVAVNMLPLIVTSAAMSMIPGGQGFAIRNLAGIGSSVLMMFHDNFQEQLKHGKGYDYAWKTALMNTFVQGIIEQFSGFESRIGQKMGDAAKNAIRKDLDGFVKQSLTPQGFYKKATEYIADYSSELGEEFLQEKSTHVFDHLRNGIDTEMDPDWYFNTALSMTFTVGTFKAATDYLSSQAEKKAYHDGYIRAMLHPDGATEVIDALQAGGRLTEKEAGIKKNALSGSKPVFDNIRADRRLTDGEKKKLYYMLAEKDRFLMLANNIEIGPSKQKYQAKADALQEEITKKWEAWNNAGEEAGRVNNNTEIGPITNEDAAEFEGGKPQEAAPDGAGQPGAPANAGVVTGQPGITNTNQAGTQPAPVPKTVPPGEQLPVLGKTTAAVVPYTPRVTFYGVMGENAVVKNEKGEAGVINVDDGGKVTVEYKGRIEELGNIDDLSDEALSDHGLTIEDASAVANRTYKVGNNLFISDNLENAIEYDADGNVSSVTLMKVNKGAANEAQKFEGQQAENLAYQITLDKFSNLQSNEGIRTIEALIPEKTGSISETAPEGKAETPQPSNTAVEPEVRQKIATARVVVGGKEKKITVVIPDIKRTEAEVFKMIESGEITHLEGLAILQNGIKKNYTNKELNDIVASSLEKKEEAGIVETNLEELEHNAEDERDASLGTAEERRAKGEFTEDGVTYKRNEKSEGIKGKSGEVRFASGVVVPFTYKLAEADNLQPSHQGGIVNKKYFIPEAQPKPRTGDDSIITENGFADSPRFNELGQSAYAFSGAPVVNERDEVVQGHNRSAGLKKGYAQGNDKYKNDLVNNAEKFGFTKEQVDGMKNPILVREIKVDDSKAIELGNYDVKDLESGDKNRRIDPIATSRRIPYDIKTKILKLLFSGKEDATTNQKIRDNQDGIIKLVSPYLNQTQRATLVKDGKLSTVGMEDVESLIEYFMFDGGHVSLPELFDNLSHTQREGLKKALPYIYSVSRNKGLLRELQNALIGLNEFKSSGLDFGSWLKQSDVFNEGMTPVNKYSPVELALVKKLDEAKNQTEIKTIFAEYAKLVNGTEKDMFSEAVKGLSKKDAIKQQFNVNYNERQNTKQDKGGGEVAGGPAKADTNEGPAAPKAQEEVKPKPEKPAKKEKSKPKPELKPQPEEDFGVMDEKDVLALIAEDPETAVEMVIVPEDYGVFPINLYAQTDEDSGVLKYYLELGNADPKEFATYDSAVNAFDDAVANYEEKPDLVEGDETIHYDTKKSEDIFPVPRNSKNLTTSLKKEITPEEAAIILQSWRDHVKEISKNEDHSKEVIISLFDASGEWSKPYKEAGYTVMAYDLKRGDDITKENWILLRADIEASGMKVVGILSAPPCTSFAGSGARWWGQQHDVVSEEWVRKKYGRHAAKYFDRPLDYAVFLAQQVELATSFLNPSLFHVLENPVGRIQKETGFLPSASLVFNPHNFGDPYTKKTLIWGKMNTNLPTANVNPVEGSRVYNLRGDNADDKALRSLTPEGFAYAFFMANNTSKLSFGEEAKPADKQLPPEPDKKAIRKIRDQALADQIDKKLRDYLSSGPKLHSGGFDPELLSKGVEIIGLYVKGGVYKFNDIVEDAVSSFGDTVKGMFNELRAAYLAYYGTATDEESEKMDLVGARNLKFEDVIKPETNESENRTGSDREGLDRIHQGIREGLFQGIEQEGFTGETGPEGAGGVSQEGSGNQSRGGERRQAISPRRGRRSGKNVSVPGTVSLEQPDLFSQEAERLSSPNHPIPGEAPLIIGTTSPNPAPLNNYVPNKEEETAKSFSKTRHFEKNLKAIKALLAIIKDGDRLATAEEKEILSDYVGWGGIKAVNRIKGSTRWSKSDLPFKPMYEELVGLISEFEGLGFKGLMKDISRSTLNAHYTSPDVIKGIYHALNKLGFTGGSILEPSAGIGNFIGYAPKNVLDKSSVTAIELDKFTGKILEKLYPSAYVKIKGYQDVKIANNSVDLIISNIPFGNYNVVLPSNTTDSEIAKQAAGRIHNYFFVKAIEQAREGGLVAFVTSTGVLDSPGNEFVRNYINDNTEFLGAIRLPSSTFKVNAGTEVVTDILFLKKNSGQKTNPDMVQIGEISVPGGNVPINNYFINNPDHVIGDIKFEHALNGMELVVEYNGNDIGKRINQIVDKYFPENVYTKRTEEVDIDAPPIGDEKAENKITIDKDGVFINENNERKPIEMGLEKARTFIALRDSLDRQYKLESSPDASEHMVDKNRAELNRLYDTFVGVFKRLNDPKNAKVILKDKFGYNVLALERKDDNGRIVKADIFTKRGIVSTRKATKASNISDAISINYNETGSIDVERIASLLGEDSDGLVERYYGDLFYDSDGSVVGREEYLSGNVKKKYKEAYSLIGGNELYQKNIDALAEVLPKDIPIEEIDINIGQRWVPLTYYKEFADYLFKTKTKVKYDPITDSYAIDGHRTGEATAGWGIVGKIDGYSLLLHAMHGSTPLVYAPGPTPGSRVVDQKNTELAAEKVEALSEEFRTWVVSTPERTEALQGLYNDSFNTNVKRKFSDVFTVNGMGSEITLKEHQKRGANMIVSNNGGIVDHMVGAGKTFLMISAALKMRQLGVANKPMIVGLKSTMQDLASDAKKLFPMAKILSPSESDFKKENRKKLLSTIQNNDWDLIIISHEQFSAIPQDREFHTGIIESEIEEIEAALAALEAESGEPASRKLIQGLTKRKENLRAKIQELARFKKDEELLSFKEIGIDHLFVDESQQFKNLVYTTRINRVAGLGKQDGSKRAYNMLIAARTLQALHGGDKGVTFVSGTPISNSLVEMYLLFKYLRPKRMQELGYNTFDAWINQFAIKSKELEFNVAGTISGKTRFREFVNVPELSLLYNEIADVRNERNITLKRPSIRGGKPTLVAVKQSAAQREWTERIIKFAKQEQGKRDGRLIGKGTLTDGEQSSAMLMVTTIGNKLSNDLRLIDKNAEFNPDGKLAAVANKVKEEYDNSKDIRGTQLIFSDIGTPRTGNIFEDVLSYLEDEKNIDVDSINLIFGEPNEETGIRATKPIKQIRERIKEYLEYSDVEVDAVFEEAKNSSKTSFNTYGEIKRLLVEKGIPADEVVFIHDYKSKNKRKALFADVNSGKVRVVIGSTQKLGTGVNVQERIVAMHHVDARWTPADMEQRNGRGIRQGNLNTEVAIFQYGTEQTVDAYKYQLIATKQRFIDQVKSGAITSRTVKEDDGENMTAQEFVALLSGNPLLLEKAKLEALVNKLARLQKAFIGEQNRIRAGVANNERAIPRQEGFIEKRKKDIETTSKNMRVDGDGKTVPIWVIDYKQIDDSKARREAFEAKVESIKDKGIGASVLIGQVAGLNYTATNIEDTRTEKGGLAFSAIKYELEGEMPYQTSSVPANTVALLPENLAKAEKVLADTKKDLESYKAALKDKWPREDELTEARVNLSRVLIELTENQEKEIAPPPQDAVAANDVNEVDDEDEDYQQTDQRFVPLDADRFNQLLGNLNNAVQGRLGGVLSGSDFDAKVKGKQEIRSGVKIFGFKDSHGKVWLNGDEMNANTPIHEYGHVLIDLMEKVRPDIFKKGMEIADKLVYVDMLLAKGPNSVYANDIAQYKKGNKTGLLKEALAMAIGDRGEQIVNVADKNRFKAWLKDFWNSVKKFFGGNLFDMSPEQVQNLTPLEFIELAAGQLVGGEEVSDVPLGIQNRDISKNAFNYDNPYAQKNVNGVDFRIAEGLVRDNKKTYLLYADGKIIGEYGSVQEAKVVVDSGSSLEKALKNASELQSKNKISELHKLSKAYRDQKREQNKEIDDLVPVSEFIVDSSLGLKLAGMDFVVPDEGMWFIDTMNIDGVTYDVYVHSSEKGDDNWVLRKSNKVEQDFWDIKNKEQYPNQFPEMLKDIISFNKKYGYGAFDNIETGLKLKIPLGLESSIEFQEIGGREPGYVTAARREYERAKKALASAEERISRMNVTEHTMFGAPKGGSLFGVKGEDIKTIINPLREKLAVAKEALTKALAKAVVEENASRGQMDLFEHQEEIKRRQSAEELQAAKDDFKAAWKDMKTLGAISDPWNNAERLKRVIDTLFRLAVAKGVTVKEDILALVKKELDGISNYRASRIAATLDTYMKAYNNPNLDQKLTNLMTAMGLDVPEAIAFLELSYQEKDTNKPEILKYLNDLKSKQAEFDAVNEPIEAKSKNDFLKKFAFMLSAYREVDTGFRTVDITGQYEGVDNNIMAPDINGTVLHAAQFISAQHDQYMREHGGSTKEFIQVISDYLRSNSNPVIAETISNGALYFIAELEATGSKFTGPKYYDGLRDLIINESVIRRSGLGRALALGTKERNPIFKERLSKVEDFKQGLHEDLTDEELDEANHEELEDEANYIRGEAEPIRSVKKMEGSVSLKAKKKVTEMPAEEVSALREKVKRCK